MNQRSRTRILIVTAVGLGLLLSLIAFELGLRLTDKMGWINLWNERQIARSSSIWIQSENPALIYQHRPNYIKNGIQVTERNGILRAEDAACQAPPDVFRIAVFGDSVAAGLDIEPERRMFALVERDLNKHLVEFAGVMGIEPSHLNRVEVLNFAVNGYSSLQEVELAAAMVPRFKPNMIILQYCANDFYTSRNPSGWFLPQSLFYTFDFVKYRIEKYQIKRRFIGGYPPVAHWKKLYDEDEVGWANVERAFAQLVRMTNKLDIPAILAIYPLLSREGWESGSASDRHKKVSTLGKAAGFSVLDLLPVFISTSVDELRIAPYDTFHFNDQGHRTAANEIVNYLLAK